jgi:hypothetical protein
LYNYINMSGYTFKTSPLEKVITISSNSSGPGFGFTYNTTPYANSKPLPISYQINKVDISNTARAYYENIPTTTTVDIPSGAKSFRFMGVGGGGGKGGKGGNQQWTAISSPNYANGGTGGEGGNGGWIYIGKTSIPSSITTIAVTVGGGGGKGADRGLNYAQTYNSASGGYYKSGSGGKGGDGGTTYYKMGTVKSSVAQGGTGGGGGEGGRVRDAPGSNYSYNGGTGSAGASSTQTSSSSWDNSAISNTNNRVKTKPGKAHIIWLYD